MSPKINEITEMLNALPVSEQELAYQFVQRLVLAWDPDYTKVTTAESEQIAKAKQSEFVDASEIDWNNLSQYEN